MIDNTNRVDYLICRTQQQIYEYMAEQGYDMAVFSNAYLSSDFCKREMDTLYSRFQTEFPNECADFFIPEICNKLRKRENTNVSAYDISLAGDIGYMYRMLYINTSITSAVLTKLIPYEKMVRLCYNIQHYGDDEIMSDIVAEYDLQLKRYDSDVVPWTKEQMRQYEEKYLKEQAELTEKFLSQRKVNPEG